MTINFLAFHKLEWDSDLTLTGPYDYSTELGIVLQVVFLGLLS